MLKEMSKGRDYTFTSRDETPKRLIEKSKYISRDLSWISFNRRVLEQAKKERYSLPERLKFIAIAARNADEFFIIRVGSLYNYIDYGKERIDYSGMSVHAFRQYLLTEYAHFFQEQNHYFAHHLLPLLPKHGLALLPFSALSDQDKHHCLQYFKEVVYPMLTPVVYDSTQDFPVLMNQVIVVVVLSRDTSGHERMSFVQIPKNIPRFYAIEGKNKTILVPIERIVEAQLPMLFRNVTLLNTASLRLTRNGDFTLEESEDIEVNLIEELKSKLKTRRTGRVVRLEVEDTISDSLLKSLSTHWDIDAYNVMKPEQPSLIDLRSLYELVNHARMREHMPRPIPPMSLYYRKGDIFEMLKKRDVFVHCPYHSFDLLEELLEQAADDPHVLSIKLTLYRVAKHSKVIEALIRAAEQGRHVSVLFEIKARFDEERNMREALRLQKAGCHVAYGGGLLKTHTKLLLIVRKEGDKVTHYVHTGSGNYNEDTAREYIDLGLLSTKEAYANDVSEFFNVITGHSYPDDYRYLMTSPQGMREALIELLEQEIAHARKGHAAGIVLKVNSLQDKTFINALYKASQHKVHVHLIVRGVCCLKPEKPGLSDHITVRSIIGRYLEHARMFYFHNHGKPKIYIGSADIMVRSFDRRMESMVLLTDNTLKKQAIHIIDYNLRDNVNAYTMHANGRYTPVQIQEKETPFDIHKAFFSFPPESLQDISLF